MYQRPEQSRATVPGKNKIAWPKSMPGRLSALMYSAAPKYRLGSGPKKCLPSLAVGRALPASAPRGLLPPALTNFDEFCYEDSSKVRQKFDE